MAYDITDRIRLLNGGNIDYWNKVYPTVEAANLAIPNEVDTNGVNFRSGKVVQIGTETDHIEYRWVDGFEDSNLKQSVLPFLGLSAPTVSANLFNISDFLNNTGISSDGTLNNTLTGWKTSKPIPIDESKPYTVSLFNAGSKRYRFLTSELALINVAIFSTGLGQTFLASDIPSNAAYFQFSFKRAEDTDVQVAQTMVEQSAVKNPYVPYFPPIPGKGISIGGIPINNADLSLYDKGQLYRKDEVDQLIEPITEIPAIQEQLSAFDIVPVSQPNLLNPDPSLWSLDAVLTGSQGSTQGSSSYHTTPYVEVKPNTLYTGINQSSANVFRIVAFYKADKSWITSINTGSFVSSFTTPANTAYTRQSVPTVSSSALGGFGLFEGSSPSFKPYGAAPIAKIAGTQIDSSQKSDSEIATILDIKNLAETSGSTDGTFAYTYNGQLIIDYGNGNSMVGSVINNKGYNGNNMFNFVSYNMFGVSSNAGDDVAPTHTQNTTLGANHAQPSSLATVSGHGLTNADIGTFWTASNGVKFYVMRIVDANTIMFLSENRGTPTSPIFNYMSTGVFTKGASSITVSAVNTSNQQLFPSIKNLSIKVVKNGSEVITNSTGRANYIDVVESYEIMSSDDVLNNIIARAGSSSDPVYTGDSVTRIENTYRFLPDSTVIIMVNMIALKTNAFADLMGTQAITFGNNAAAQYYVPNSSPVSGYDFRTPLSVAWSGSVPQLFFTVSDQPDPTNPPNRIINYRNNAGFMIGALKTRGVGKALHNYTNRTFEIRNNTGKMYPHVVEGSKVGGTLSPGSVYNAVMFRSYTSLTVTRTGNRLSYFNFNFEGTEYLYVDYSGSMFDKINLNKPQLNGCEIEVIESRNCTLNSDTYNDGLYITCSYVTGQTAFIVLSIY